MALTSSSVINGENLTRKYDDEGKNIGAELQKVTDLGDIYVQLSVHIQAELQNISPCKIRPTLKNRETGNMVDEGKYEIKPLLLLIQVLFLILRLYHLIDQIVSNFGF